MIKKALFTGLALVISLVSFAQITKGKISYDMYFSTDDPQVSAYIDRLENSLLEIYFDEGKSRSNFFMGDLMTTNSITVEGKDTTLVLLDGMMGRIAMKVTKEDMDEEQRQSTEVESVDFVSGETKEIIGYTCKKAIVTLKNGGKAEVWYTEEIVPPYREGQYLYEKIPGLPLEINTTYRKSMDLKIVAFEFKKKIKKPEEVFSLEVPEKYTIMTAEEMKSMRQGQ